MKTPRTFDSIEREWENKQENDRCREEEEAGRKADREFEESLRRQHEHDHAEYPEEPL